MNKWKRFRSAQRYNFWAIEDGDQVMVEVNTSWMEIHYDPRTGKPWRSMKAMREWFDSVTKER